MARKIAVVDSETDPFKYGRVPAPFIWGYYNGNEYHYFNTTYELVEFLKPRNEIIYAHNGGKFDWHFVLPYLEDGQEIIFMKGGRGGLGNSNFATPTNQAPEHSQPGEEGIEGQVTRVNRSGSGQGGTG